MYGNADVQGPRLALTILVKDLGTSLEPDGLLEGDTILGKQLWGEASQGSKHGPPGMDHLNLPVPVCDSNSCRYEKPKADVADNDLACCGTCSYAQNEFGGTQQTGRIHVVSGLQKVVEYSTGAVEQQAHACRGCCCSVRRRINTCKWHCKNGRIGWLPGESLGVGGQTGCVPSVIASELSAQVVGGDTLAEGT